MGNPRQAIDTFNNLRQQNLILGKSGIILPECDFVFLKKGVVLCKRFALGVQQQFHGLGECLVSFSQLVEALIDPSDK